MNPMIYPTSDTAALLGKPAFAPISLAAGEDMAVFAPFEVLLGSDLATHLRIAMSGPAVPADTPPTIELLAQEPNALGGDPTKVDPRTATSVGTAVALSGGLSPVAARAFFTPPYTDNVYLLTVLVDVPDTRLWLRIGNATGIARDFVWVVADKAEKTRQPWMHIEPAVVALQTVTNQTVRRELRIANRGTGDLVVDGLSPGFPDGPYESAVTPETLTIGPNSSGVLRLELAAGTQAVAPQTIPQQVDCNDPGPFGAAGHNRDVALSLGVEMGGPRFRPPPDEFSPKRGPHSNDETGEPGCRVTLSGSNFDGPDLAVLFDEVDASGWIMRHSPSEIEVAVPPMTAPREVHITVRVNGLAAVSEEEFAVVPQPVVDEFEGMRFANMLDPSNTEFTILGSNFVTDVEGRVGAALSFPSVSDGFIRLDILTFTNTRMRVKFPQVPNFHRFIGETGFVVVTRSDDGRGELEFFLEGL